MCSFGNNGVVIEGWNVFHNYFELGTNLLEQGVGETFMVVGFIGIWYAKVSNDIVCQGFGYGLGRHVIIWDKPSNLVNESLMVKIQLGSLDCGEILK